MFGGGEGGGIVSRGGGCGHQELRSGSGRRPQRFPELAVRLRNDLVEQHRVGVKPQIGQAVPGQRLVEGSGAFIDDAVFIFANPHPDAVGQHRRQLHHPGGHIPDQPRLVAVLRGTEYLGTLFTVEGRQIQPDTGEDFALSLLACQLDPRRVVSTDVALILGRPRHLTEQWRDDVLTLPIGQHKGFPGVDSLGMHQTPLEEADDPNRPWCAEVVAGLFADGQPRM
jgi:hypothetical protein